VIRIIDSWISKVRTHILETYCKIYGHDFKDAEDMTYGYKGKVVTEQWCRCGKKRLIYTISRIPLTETESHEYYGTLVWIYLNLEADIYSLLTREPWKGPMDRIISE